MLLLALLALGHGWAPAALGANAPDLICGPDPAILTPFYPVKMGASGPRLQVRPDVKFVFEGERPCEPNTCRIVVKDRLRKNIVITIRLPSKDVTYCRDSRPFSELPSIDNGNKSACFGGAYSSFRGVLFGKTNELSSSMPGVWIERIQNKRGNIAASNCRGVSDGEKEVFGEVLRFRAGNSALIKIYQSPFPWNNNGGKGAVIVPKSK